MRGLSPAVRFVAARPSFTVIVVVTLALGLGVNAAIFSITRAVLGATRSRIARDLAGETLLLTLAGAGIAVLLAVWVVAVLNAVVSFQDVNRLEAFRVDRWVIAFTTGLGCAIGVLFAMLPAHRAGDADLVDALKDSTQGVTPGLSNRTCVMH